MQGVKRRMLSFVVSSCIASICFIQICLVSSNLSVRFSDVSDRVTFYFISSRIKPSTQYLKKKKNLRSRLRDDEAYETKPLQKKACPIYTYSNKRLIIRHHPSSQPRRTSSILGNSVSQVASMYPNTPPSFITTSQMKSHSQLERQTDRKEAIYPPLSRKLHIFTTVKLKTLLISQIITFSQPHH